MLRSLALSATIAGATLTICGASAGATPIQVYGTWHCGSDFCNWGVVRDMTEFDAKNHWLVDRGDGLPSVNLVVLSFVNPLKLLNSTTDSTYTQGIPNGMNADVVSYFTSRNIRVMLSIGGITFVDDWDTALGNPTQLAVNAAQAAARLGVGIEIDYEQNTNPKLDALAAFINAYRASQPYDATGTNPAARLTIDLGAGDRFLIDITRRATSSWLTTGIPVLDYANAMVPNRQPNGAADAQSNWQEHVDGKSRFSPPIGPLAPAKFTGALYLTTGRKAIPECNNFSASLESSTGSYVQSVAPNGAGVTPGMLGYMFWASECSSTTRVCTTPPNGCQSGVGAGARTYGVPFPMPPLRQN
jgi:hypothetical protein